MAKIKVVMPQMGESITTGTITKWRKQVGEIIEIDEILLDISTDKVESEIPSPVKGKVAELLYPEGDTVDVGKPIAYIEDDLNASFDASSSSKSTPARSAPPMVEKVEHAPRENKSTQAQESSFVESAEGRRFYTPLVKKLAQESGVPLSELSTLEGSGAGGRVNRHDFEEYAKNRQSGSSKVASVSSTSASASSKAATMDLPKVDAMVGYTGAVDVITMDNMRKVIARNMVTSKLTSPHVNSVSEVDLTHLVKFREGFKSEFERKEGFKLTYTPFILHALAQALKDFPMVNSSLDGDKILVKKEIHLGCAVAVPGNGLVVPIIRGADNLNMLGICRKLNDLANRARAKKLTLDELQGGTFTFTNVGSFGTLLATPVILQPQVGIYAAGVIQKRVVVTRDDSIAIRSMMYGTHTYDHRLIDGEQGGKFLEAVHEYLRQMKPETMF